MNPEDVGRILDEIGERMGPAGEYAWGLSLRQTFIDSVTFTILGVLAVSIGVWIARYIWRRNSDGTFAIYNGDDRAFASMIPGLLIVAGTPLLLTGIGMLLNPEYHAMVRLLERIVP